MKTRASLRLFALALLVLCSRAPAQDDAVVVSAVRDPVKKSYRKMLEGAKLFEERRSLAPAAALRFRLVPRTPDDEMKGVQLEVASDSIAIPLKVSPDRTFAIERNAVALAEDAQVMPNRRKGTLTWRADVRTPGLPPNVRRLGDLRLECEVGMKAGLVSNYPAGFLGWLEELFGKGPEYCHRARPRYVFFAERAIWSITLVDGARREVLPVEMLYAGATRDPDWKNDRYCDCQASFDRTYFVPLGDASWPDDTLVVIDDMLSALTAGESTKAAVRAALGEATVVDFPSGYEVWVYRQAAKAQQPPAPEAELVLLFEPSGVLVRTRVR